ncbi:hypothetical protein HMPREF9098_1636 [Kingella denitrificans ATCC 33394]|uniref:Uncharacterized protein n=1 Tax=Kingella denitrificans ATCC 33394 TaxID=888741 RepID=F0F0K1_9NEIS|nr:hypothetical protein HMPREF9098_1636 [Kingella denitrificans ATCC 33394]
MSFGWFADVPAVPNTYTTNGEAVLIEFGKCRLLLAFRRPCIKRDQKQPAP